MIAILATISIVAYSGIQTRARASAVVSDLNATKTALRSYMIISGTDGWMRDNSPLLANTSNTSIQMIIDAQPEFRKLLQKPPSTVGLNSPDYTYGWFYDYDGDVFPGGCHAGATGANLILNNAIDINLLVAIDAALDDGNLECGKVQGDQYVFFYNLD